MSFKKRSLVLKCKKCELEISNMDELVGDDSKNCPNCQSEWFGVIDIIHQRNLLHANKQQAVLTFLKRYMSVTKEPPTIREVQEGLSFTNVSTVYYHLKVLREEGYISFEKGKMYTLKLLPKSEVDRMDDLSLKQLHLLKTIHEFVTSKGYSPTSQELRDLLNLNSVSTLDYHVNILQQEGFLTREKHQARTMRVTKEGVFLLNERNGGDPS